MLTLLLSGILSLPNAELWAFGCTVGLSLSFIWLCAWLLGGEAPGRVSLYALSKTRFIFEEIKIFCCTAPFSLDRKIVLVKKHLLFSNRKEGVSDAHIWFHRAITCKSVRNRFSASPRGQFMLSIKNAHWLCFITLSVFPCLPASIRTKKKAKPHQCLKPNISITWQFFPFSEATSFPSTALWRLRRKSSIYIPVFLSM